MYDNNMYDDIPDDVMHILALPSIRAIKNYAFWEHDQLVTVILNNGLEEIKEEAFGYCTLLQCIIIPHTIKANKNWAFSNCSGLTTVTLGNGVKEIGKEALYQCTLLECIITTATIKTIKNSAFEDCSNLKNIDFCKKFEEVVSCNAMQEWWNQGVHETSLSKYCFLI
jgi:hypothetical protein